MFRNLSMKKKLLLLLPLLLSATGAAIWLFFANTLWIPPGMQVKKLIYFDIFSGSHMQLSEGSKLFTVENVEYLSHDDSKSRTVYRFTLAGDVGEVFTAEAYYPGTPSRQYYRYPRLRSSMKLMLLTHPENAASGMLYDAYWLFLLQEIDGETYAYPLLFDPEITPYSLLGNRVEFAYQEESLIYDPWYDADVLKKCENPEFAYKVKYSDLEKNYPKILR